MKIVVITAGAMLLTVLLVAWIGEIVQQIHREDEKD